VVGEATEPSAPPYEDRFSHKITIQFNDDSDSDLMSDEEGPLAQQAQGTMIWRSLHGPRIFLFLLKVPCRLPCRQLTVKERIPLVLNVTLCSRPDPNNLGMEQRFHEKIPFKTLKEVKQACTMYGSTEPFMLGLSQTVVGDTAMPPDDWTGLAKACLSPGDYLLWKTGFVDLCQE
jgi:hypothetical protein